jgi:hypothetical protein
MKHTVLIVLTYDDQGSREDGSVYYSRYFLVQGAEDKLKAARTPHMPTMEQFREWAKSNDFTLIEMKANIIEVDYDYDEDTSESQEPDVALS